MLSAFGRSLRAHHSGPLRDSGTVVWFAQGGVAVREGMVDLLREGVASPQKLTNCFNDTRSEDAQLTSTPLHAKGSIFLTHI